VHYTDKTSDMNGSKMLSTYLFLITGVIFLAAHKASSVDTAHFLTPNAKIGLQRLEKMFGKDSKSNCFGAVDMVTLKSMSMTPFHTHSRLDVPYSKDEGVSRYINFGAGTTGTRFLFHDVICLHISGTHYVVHCNTDRAKYKESILRTITNSTKSHDFLNSILAFVTDTLNVKHGGSYWTDSPVAEIFTDLIGLRPWALTMASYRGPESWAKSRIANHGSVPICHLSLWNRSEVLHPYDYIACLKMKTYSKDALTSINTISAAQLEGAYIKMNTVNAFVALSRNVPFLPICVYDSATDNTKAVTDLLVQNGMKLVKPVHAAQ
jgi:hypothetical protein